MALTRFTRTDRTWPRAGEWRCVIIDGKRTARLGCPGCHYGAVLDHEIDAAGNVTPSVQCPNCSYHETGVVLEGWVP